MGYPAVEFNYRIDFFLTQPKVSIVVNAVEGDPAIFPASSLAYNYAFLQEFFYCFGGIASIESGYFLPEGITDRDSVLPCSQQSFFDRAIDNPFSRREI